MFGELQNPIAKARRRRHGQRGVTALEFALVAPIVILVIFFTIEMGILMMADATLGRVAANIARQGQLDQMGGTNCTSRAKVMLTAGVDAWVYDDDDIDVQLLNVYEPVAFAAPQPGVASAPMCAEGGPGAIMVYRLGFKSAGFSGVLNWLNINFLRFERTVVLQNEP